MRLPAKGYTGKKKVSRSHLCVFYCTGYTMISLVNRSKLDPSQESGVLLVMKVMSLITRVMIMRHTFSETEILASIINFSIRTGIKWLTTSNQIL